mmetsp:Transcript_25937/g.80143  ORF Transcript_25937/g.80143 Transcript_25937/m.80143 type:complete len:235 (-) Transcript_25937:738-1442(-)
MVSLILGTSARMICIAVYSWRSRMQCRRASSCSVVAPTLKKKWSTKRPSLITLFTSLQYSSLNRCTQHVVPSSRIATVGSTVTRRYVTSTARSARMLSANVASRRSGTLPRNLSNARPSDIETDRDPLRILDIAEDGSLSGAAMDTVGRDCCGIGGSDGWRRLPPMDTTRSVGISDSGSLCWPFPAPPLICAIWKSSFSIGFVWRWYTSAMSFTYWSTMSCAIGSLYRDRKAKA